MAIEVNFAHASPLKNRKHTTTTNHLIHGLIVVILVSVIVTVLLRYAGVN
ncbi:hypothetical protein ID853_10570 [Xenorhabdus sp. Vera]|nr:hypothetical protein [Xenorhabdus sp. Vera]